MGEDTRDAKLKEIFTKYAKQGRPDGQVGMTFEDFEAFMRVRSASFFFLLLFVFSIHLSGSGVILHPWFLIFFLSGEP
jgi:hypothetical protein